MNNNDYNDSNNWEYVDLKSYLFEYLDDRYFTEENAYWLLSQKVKLEEILFFLERGFYFLEIPDLVEMYGVERWEKMEDSFYEKGLILGKDFFEDDILMALEKENRKSSS